MTSLACVIRPALMIGRQTRRLRRGTHYVAAKAGRRSVVPERRVYRRRSLRRPTAGSGRGRWLRSCGGCRRGRLSRGCRRCRLGRGRLRRSRRRTAAAAGRN